MLPSNLSLDVEKHVIPRHASRCVRNEVPKPDVCEFASLKLDLSLQGFLVLFFGFFTSIVNSLQAGKILR